MRAKNLILLFTLLLIIFIICIPVFSNPTANDEETGELKHRVSTEGLSGYNLLLVNLYNDHRIAYATVTTVAMAVFGGLIALVVDFILARVGLTVSKIEHRE